MEKKTLLIIGLIGGIIAAAGVFLPWITVSFMGISISGSGWDLTAGISSPYVALLGGVIALLSGLGLVAMKSPPAILRALLPIGGLIAIAGAAWGYSDVSGGLGFGEYMAGAGVSIGVGYGVYLCIVGGIIALICSLAARGK